MHLAYAAWGGGGGMGVTMGHWDSPVEVRLWLEAALREPEAEKQGVPVRGDSMGRRVQWANEAV